MKGTILRVLLCMVLISALFASISQSTRAQGEPVPRPDEQRRSRPGQLQGREIPIKPGHSSLPSLAGQPEGGRMSEAAIPSSPEATGGPDYFGYTWNNGVSINWRDATSGTALPISGYSDWEGEGPIGLPFPFKFYDETFSYLYIGASGFITFDDLWEYPPQQDPMPDFYAPNRVIAGFWTPMYLASSGTNGRIFYKSGGSAPNRYFVVEWHNVPCGPSGDACGADDRYQFEIVLWENGNIDLQYRDMIYVDTWVWYASIGIEDRLGNGLHYMDWGDYWSRRPGDNAAIRITRPAPKAYFRAYPQQQGGFAAAGQVTEIPVILRNTGDLGSDTFDLTGSPAWPTTWVGPDHTPLVDTDSDGMVDSGPIAQGISRTVYARVQAPVIAHPGDHADLLFTARSSLNPSFTRPVSLQVVVPLPFAQAYGRSPDPGISTAGIHPAGETITQSTPWGYNTGIVEVDESKWLTFWNDGRCLDITNCNVYVNEIYYTLTGHDGSVARAPAKLVDHSSAVMDTYDYDPAAATSPDGHAGFTWYRRLYNPSTDLWNYNIYFAILDVNGNLSYGPVNVTNNNLWGSWSNPIGIPRYFFHHITATEDNRFTIAWERDQDVTTDSYLYDVYYTVVSSAGSTVKAVTKLTNDVADYDGYYEPVLTALTGNRVMMVYYAINHLVYIALDSAGNVLTGEYSLANAGWDTDAIQLSSGQVCVVWTNENYDIAYAILDGGTYAILSGPNSMSHSAAIGGNSYPSVSADQAGHAIVTWRDEYWFYEQSLYYATLNANGTVHTQPMIYRNAGGESDWIETSPTGHGNAPFTITDIHPGVDLNVTSHESQITVPGVTTFLPVSFGNTGLTPAGSVITATLDSHLTYLGDTSGLTPVINGSTLRWDFSASQLAFLGQGGFTLSLQASAPPPLAAGPVDTIYLVSWQVGSSAADDDPLDNTFVSEIVIGKAVFLPLVKR